MHYSCSKCEADFYPSAPHENLDCPNGCGAKLTEHKGAAFVPPPTFVIPPDWEEQLADRLEERNEGRKSDTSKNPLDLLPVDALQAVGAVLQYGATKYEPRNWEKGLSWSRVYGAILRHLFAWWRGEDRDPESGLTHLSHAACCLLFLLTYELRKTGKDDHP